MQPSAPISHVVASLAEVVVAAESRGAPNPVAVAWVADQLCGKLDTMPRFLALGMSAMTIAFDASGTFAGGLPFHRLSLERRVGWLKAWRRAPVSVLGDFVDFYEKMGVFTYWCWVEEQQAGAHGH
jgi:hypothetical protein